MIAFWGAALVLTGLIGFFLLRPILKQRESATASAELAWDLTVYRDQLGEVDSDLEKGLLNPEEADAARTEIKRRMLDADRKYNSSSGETAEAGASSARSASLRMVYAGIVAIVLPVGAIAGYSFSGSMGLEDQPLAERLERRQEMADMQNLSLPELAGRLEQKLAERPGDLNGWVLLARSRSQMGEYDKAVLAMEKAVSLAPDEAAAHATLAEMRLAAAGGNFSEEVTAGFRKAFELDRMDPRALFYLGLYRFEQQDYEGSLETWNVLARHSPADAPWMPALRKNLQVVAANTDHTLEELLPEAAAPARPPMMSAPAGEANSPIAGSAGPTREQVEAAQEMSAEDQEAMIRSMVGRLAARLEENPGDADGWERLARAWTVLGETEKAAEAMEKAAEARGK